MNPHDPTDPIAASSLGEALPEAIFEDACNLLQALTAISSPSGDRDGLHRAAGLLAGALQARGLEAAVVDEAADEAAEGAAGEGGPTLPVLHARGPGSAAAGHLLLIGHLDTVLPAAPPRREGGRLLATGAIDMKGGLVTLVGALDLLHERGIAPPPGLRLVVVPDEEVSGPLSRRAVHAWGAGARAVWVLEPGEPREDGTETIVAGRRGLFLWRLQVEGRAAHSGLHYWQGRSALAAAARWCAGAEALSRPGPGPTVNAGRLIAGAAGFLDGVLAGDIPPGLIGSDSQLNVVPDRALAEGEARFFRPSEEREIETRLRAMAAELAAETGTVFRFELGQRIPPVDPQGPQRAWCERAVALARARGWTLEVDEERGGISFPNFLPDPGRIPVLDGLGPVGGGMHTREEFVDLASLRRRIVLLADLLEAEAAD
jgi:glutamate carboxypeptidase